MPSLSEVLVNSPHCPPAFGGLVESFALSQPIRVCHVSMCLQTGVIERLLVDFARLHDRKKFELQFIHRADR
jgi:hypothetical protein